MCSGSLSHGRLGNIEAKALNSWNEPAVVKCSAAQSLMARNPFAVICLAESAWRKKTLVEYTTVEWSFMLFVFRPLHLLSLLADLILSPATVDLSLRTVYAD